MVISFMWANSCARCKRKREKGDKSWGAFQLSMDKGLLHWFQPRFLACPSCINEMIELADANANINRILDQPS